MSQFCQIVAERLPSGRYRLKCSACGFDREFSRPSLVRRCGASPPASKLRGPCAHLGDVLRLQECPTCGGKQKVRIKVFSCPLHGECVLGTKIGQLTQCRNCDDWSDTHQPV